MLSSLESTMSNGLRGPVSSSVLSSVVELCSEERLDFGYRSSSYSELLLLDAGRGAIEIGGVVVTCGRYSSNRYLGARSRGVPLSRTGLTARIISSSKIMLLLMLTFRAYRFCSVGEGGSGLSVDGGGGSAFSVVIDLESCPSSNDFCLRYSAFSFLLSLKPAAFAKDSGCIPCCSLNPAFCGLFGKEATSVF